MSKILENLEKKLEQRLQEKIGILEPKLDKMIYLLECIDAKLKRIEENMRK